MFNLFKYVSALFVVTLTLACSTEGKAQQLDPSRTLGVLISAFQNCGPVQAYQLLGPQVYQAVFMQTNGQGCYSSIRQAGPVTSMQIMSQQQFPAGPIYQIRVSHGATVVDWFIGISQFTGRVEYLTFQAASTVTPPPDINKGPSPGGGGPSGGGGGNPPDRGGGSGGDGCALYPSMCVQ
jgi:hypothetical protein